jgi:hypothetical protein
MFSDDSAVKKWLSNYEVEGHNSRLSYLKSFIEYVRTNPEFKDCTPESLVEYQRHADKDHEYVILDLLQAYIQKTIGTHKSLSARYSTIKSLFLKNRATLPIDGFRIKGTREPTRDKLDLDTIKTLISVSPLEGKAVYLSLFQGILDLERFRLFNEKYGFALGEHIKTKGIDEPFCFEFFGRKGSKNKTTFYTFVGHDCLESWKAYFERIRGYPREGEPIIRGVKGEALGKKAFQIRHTRLLARLKFIERQKGIVTARYGFGLHNLRDLSRTVLHLQAKKDGLDEACIEFWMGHITDKNFYDKFYEDRDYVLKNYRIAEKYLNVVSGGYSNPDLERQLKETESKIQRMEKWIEEEMALRKILDEQEALRERAGIESRAKKALKGLRKPKKRSKKR